MFLQDGSMRWVEFTGQIERRADGSPWRMIGATADITARKQIEERERRLTAEAVSATAKFRAVFERENGVPWVNGAPK